MAFVVPEIPVPIDLPSPGGDVVRGQFPQGVPLELAPSESVDSSHGWPGIFTWVEQHFFTDTAVQPVDVNWPKIVSDIGLGLYRLQQVFASAYTNLSLYFVHSVQALRTLTVALLDQLEAEVAQSSYTAQAREAVIYSTLFDQIQQLHGVIDAVAQSENQQIYDAFVTTLNTVHDTWIVPLQENLGQLYQAQQLEAQTRAEGDANIINDVVPGAITDVVSFLAPLIDDGVLALPLAQRAAQFVDECGQEMCDTMGPNTDLGKLFKALQLAALLALLRELAGADYADVESAVVDIGRRMIGVVRTFETLFVEGGQTIGETVLGFGA